MVSVLEMLKHTKYKMNGHSRKALARNKPDKCTDKITLIFPSTNQEDIAGDITSLDLVLSELRVQSRPRICLISDSRLTFLTLRNEASQGDI